MFDLRAVDPLGESVPPEWPLKAFRPPAIRAYIDLAINKRPATARAYSAKKWAPDFVAIEFTPMAWT